MLRRHGDQEYMHLVWTEHHPHLRVMPLPEEFYCPDAQVNYGMAFWESPYHRTHGWGPYRCKAVHGHGYTRVCSGICSVRSGPRRRQLGYWRDEEEYLPHLKLIRTLCDLNVCAFDSSMCVVVTAEGELYL